MHNLLYIYFVERPVTHLEDISGAPYIPQPVIYQPFNNRSFILTRAPVISFISIYLDCKDSDAYASQCPTLAGYENYCKYHHEWTKKYCAKSCGWCSEYPSFDLLLSKGPVLKDCNLINVADRTRLKVQCALHIYIYSSCWACRNS